MTSGQFFTGAIALLMASASLSSCSVEPASANVDNRSGSAIGRYQFVQAGGDMPAVLVDTTTGCIETFEKYDIDNPKPNGQRSIYVRGQSDEVVKGTPKRCRPEN